MAVFGQLVVAAAFLLVAIIPLYLYWLPARTKIDTAGQVAAKKPTLAAGDSTGSTKGSALKPSSEDGARSVVGASKPAKATGTSFSATTAAIEEEISSFLNSWISSFQARNLERHVQHYAPQLSTYFTWHNVPHRSVAQDKRRFFSVYDQIELMRIHDVRITPTSPTTAEAVFLKDWEVRGRGEFSGTVLQRLVLQRFSGTWQITSEEELKTLRRHKTTPGGLRLATFSRG